MNEWYSSSGSRISSIQSSVLDLCLGFPKSLHHFDLFLIDLFVLHVFHLLFFFLIERLSGLIIYFPLVLYIND